MLGLSSEMDLTSKASFAQHRYTGQWKILIGKERHLGSFGGGERNHSVTEAFIYKGKNSLQRLFGQSRIAFEELLFRPAVRQALQDKAHSKPRPFDGGLSQQNIFVRYDIVSPIHFAVDFGKQK